MKYLIIPLLKVLWVALYLVTMIPAVLVGCIIASIWSFNLGAFSWWNNTPYYIQREYGYPYYSYKTIFDWFWNRKTWHK